MLLFRVVSTPGGQEKSLSVCAFFCRTFFGWSIPPPPWGHTCTTTPVHRPDTAPPFSRHMHQRTRHIGHRPSSFIHHHSSFIPLVCLPKRRKKCYHFVTSLLLERWKPLCLRPFRHLRSNPTRILTLFFWPIFGLYPTDIWPTFRQLCHFSVTLCLCHPFGLCSMRFASVATSLELLWPLPLFLPSVAF